MGNIIRPADFELDTDHPLAHGLVFGGFGRIPRTSRYLDESLRRNNGVLTGYPVTTQLPTSGWGASGHGNYVFFLNNYVTNNGWPTGEYEYESTGTYDYVGGGYGGANTNHLYAEVPSDVGVTANDAASFDAYVSTHPITVIWPDVRAGWTYDAELGRGVNDFGTRANNWYIDTARPVTSGGSFSVSCWVWFRELSAASTQGEWIINQRTAPTAPREWQMFIYNAPSTPQVRFAAFNTDNNSTSVNVTDGAPSLFTWLHLAAVLDFSTGKLRGYTNGEFVQEVDFDGTPTLSQSTYVRLGQFGWPGADAVYLFGGKIADPLIYNRTLSLPEIQTLADRTDPMLGGLLVDPTSSTTYFYITSEIIDSMADATLSGVGKIKSYSVVNYSAVSELSSRINLEAQSRYEGKAKGEITGLLDMAPKSVYHPTAHTAFPAQISFTPTGKRNSTANAILDSMLNLSGVGLSQYGGDFAMSAGELDLSAKGLYEAMSHAQLSGQSNFAPVSLVSYSGHANLKNRLQLQPISLYHPVANTALSGEITLIPIGLVRYSANTHFDLPPLQLTPHGYFIGVSSADISNALSLSGNSLYIPKSDFTLNSMGNIHATGKYIPLGDAHIGSTIDIISKSLVIYSGTTELSGFGVIYSTGSALVVRLITGVFILPERGTEFILPERGTEFILPERGTEFILLKR